MIICINLISSHKRKPYPYRNANHNCTPNAKPSLTLTLTLTRNPNNPQLYCEDGTEEDPAAAEKESKKAKKKRRKEEENWKKLHEKAEAEEPNHAPTLALILINPNPNCKPIPDSRRNRRLKPRRKLRCKP